MNFYEKVKISVKALDRLIVGGIIAICLLLLASQTIFH